MTQKALSLFEQKAVRLFLILYFTGNAALLQAQVEPPYSYTCHQATTAIIVDGLDNEADWQQARWSGYFVDIQGLMHPKPYANTRVKMLWDSNYLYFFARMEEPHLWARLKQRDTVIFYDNDFEVFIDPDGDTHHYYELELNALNTVWDLLLTRPYRDGGHAIDHWDIHGLKTAVNLEGTLNNPSDTDMGWTVEIAIPWDELQEATRMKTPPQEGDQWRINFSRVQWDTEVVNGQYVKKKDPNTGKRLPEHNWVWSPMRAIAMHEPEYWGIVSFTTAPPAHNKLITYDERSDYQIRKLLYDVHKAQIAFYRKHKRYTNSFSELDSGYPRLEIEQLKLNKFEADAYGYQFILTDEKEQVDHYIDQTGQSRKFQRKDE